jgi:ferredoxin
MTLVPLIDPDTCAAHGECEVIAPDVFRVEDISTVIGAGPDDLLTRAAEGCPATAIRLVDVATREQRYP